VNPVKAKAGSAPIAAPNMPPPNDPASAIQLNMLSSLRPPEIAEICPRLR
jgi:hypothetical protein